MRRFFAYGLTIVLLAACSTQEKDFQTPKQEDVIYYASFEQPAEDGTRVYANEDLLLRWTADDRVSIFGKNTFNQQYKFLGETGDNSGGFSKVDGAEYVTGNPISHTVSVYPYQASTKITEDEVLTVTLPAEQHYSENTFGLGANTMVSISEDNFLQYKNVGGYLMLKLYGEGVTVSSITLKGNNGEKLSGKATVTMTLDGVPTVVMAENTTEEITLTCATPVQLGVTAEESTQFWFVVPPVSFSKGFTVTVSGNGGVFEKSTDKTQTIERNKLSKMAPIEVEGPQPNNVLLYTSADGHVIEPYDESVFGAHIISNTYDERGGVITFDSDVTNIGDNAFFTCSTLCSISLPNSITSIGAYAFASCSSLERIDFSKSITTILHFAFEHCISLVDVVLPDSVSFIAPNAFTNCSGLTSIIIPNGVERISSSTFAGCTSLTIIELPNSITRIEDSAFQDCSSLTSLSIPDSVTSIGAYAFYNCRSLISVVLPNKIETIEPFTFNKCSGLISVTIPQSVRTIREYSFRYCSGLSSIILLATAPPELWADVFDSTGTYPFYVPSESLSVYKTTTGWRNYSDRIYAISTPVAVDLGLPSGLKWASFNLGATKPEEYGDYYAWGETEPYYESLEPLTWKEGKEAGYHWPSYKWCNGDANKLTKYCPANMASYWDGAGIPDGKTVLDPEDDAAYVNLGGNWRMPTDVEWTELRENCTCSWTTQNGVDGYLVTGPNGNSIFFPATGFRLTTYLINAGSSGFYWSSSLCTVDPSLARDVDFYSGSVSMYSYGRYNGQSVRPVTE